MTESSTPPATRMPALVTRPWLALEFALVAGLLAWTAIQAIHPMFIVAEKYHIVSMGAPVEKSRALQVEQARVDRLNAILEVAILGGLVASGMALAATACCRSVVRVLIAFPWGAAIGAVAAFVGFAVNVSMIGDALPTVQDTIKVQATVFAILGTGIGLLIGAFTRAPTNLAMGAVAGVLAGGLAGIAYPIVASVLAPSTSVESVVPIATVARAIWIGLFILSVAWIIPRVVAAPISLHRVQ